MFRRPSESHKSRSREMSTAGRSHRRDGQPHSEVASTGGGFRSGDDSWIRGSLVRGHFKVRKTGIFWWCPHARIRGDAVTRTAYRDALTKVAQALPIVGTLTAISPIKSSSPARSEEHTSELQSLMRISYAVFCLK